MPDITPAGGFFPVRTDEFPASARSESLPLFLHRLASVEASHGAFARLQRLPQQAWQWLAQLLRLQAEPQTPETVALTEIRPEAPDEGHATLAAEEAEQQTREAQAACSARGRAGLTLALISAGGALTAAGFLCSRHHGAQPAQDMLPGTDVAPPPGQEPPRPQAVAVATPRPLPGVTPPAWVAPLVNRTRDAMLARFPGLQPEALTQRVLAPLVNGIFSLGAAGVSQKRVEQQLPLLAGVLFSTLGGPELVPLYNPARTTAETVDITPRFFYLYDDTYISVDRLPLRLCATPDGTPFVTDNDGRCRFVRYNQQTDNWEYVAEADNSGYSAKNRARVKHYADSVGVLPATSVMHYSPDWRTVTITTPGEREREGAFAGGRFVLFRYKEAEPLPGDTATASPGMPRAQQARLSCSPARGNPWLRWSPYGWVFESASSRMDDALSILLDQRHCVRVRPGRLLADALPPDGLHRDAQGLTFLKYQEQYFSVESRYNAVTGKTEFMLADFSGAVIENRDGVMLLMRADDMVFATGNTRVDNTGVSPAPFYLERGAADILWNNALRTDMLPVRKLLLPGLYKGADNRELFIVNDTRYVVRSYSVTERLIRLKGSDAPDSHAADIFLWQVGDVLLRVRDGQADTAYETLPSGYDTGGEKPVVQVEKDLQRQLTGATGSALTEADRRRLVEKAGFALPVFRTDPQQQRDYFLWQGDCFPAMLTAGDDADNPLGVNYLTVFARGDTGDGNRPLTTVVVEKKGARTEVKARESYLAEKLGVRKAVAALYLKHHPWRHVPGARAAQEAASVVAALGRHAVAPVPRVTGRSALVQTETARRNRIATALYPPGVNRAQLTFTRLTDRTFPAEDRALQQRLSATFHMVRNDMLPLLEKSLRDGGPDRAVIKPLPGGVPGSDSDEFQSALAVSWRRRVAAIMARMREEDVYVVSGKTIRLSADEKSQQPVAFVSPHDGNVYISGHKTDAQDRAQIRLVAELVRGLAQGTGMAQDIITVRQRGGMYPPYWQAQAELERGLMRESLSAAQLKNLQETARRYLNAVPAYGNRSGELLTPRVMAYLAGADPAFRSHLWLTSDHLFTGQSLDAVYRLLQAGSSLPGADAWRQAYGALRVAGLPEGEDAEEGTATTRAPHHFFHLPDRADKRKAGRRLADGEAVEQAQPEDRPARKPARPADSDAQVSQEERPEERGDNRPDTGSDEAADSSLELSHENGSEEGYDGDGESGPEDNSSRETQSGQESGSEDGYDADRESGGESDAQRNPSSGSEKGSDTGSAESRDTELEELTDSDTDSVKSRRTALRSHSLPDSFRFSDGPGLPPVPPLVPPAIPAESAAASAVAWAGMAVVGSAPVAGAPQGEESPDTHERPHLPDPPHTTTDASTSATAGRAQGQGHSGDRRLRLPERQDKNNRGLPGPDSHDDVLLPDTGDDRMGSGQGTEERVFVPGHGNVTMLTIAGLECLGEKDVTVSQYIRWIGDALTNSITANVLAQRENYQLDVKGEDCPPGAETEWLRQRTMFADALINTVVSFIPGFGLVGVLKNIVGPAMMTLADDLEGKEVSPEDRMNLLQNILLQTKSMTSAGLPTLKGTEWTPENKGASAPSDFKKRFKFGPSGSPYVTVEGKEYSLGMAYDDTPMIVDEHGRNRVIVYNQQGQRWDFDANYEQSLQDEARRNCNKYKLSPAEVSADAVLETAVHDSYILKERDKPDTSGVFVGGDFIPARIEKVANEYVAYTTTDAVSWDEQRLLFHDKYGWDFERKSVKVDIYLELLLSQNADSAIGIAQRDIGSIQSSDGLSYDRYGHTYIKRDYKYHRVDKITTGKPYQEYTLPAYENTLMKFDNGYFMLERADDILFASKTQHVKDEIEDFRIETAALQYLRDHAVKNKEAGPERVGKGMYDNQDETNAVFVVNKEKFVVSRYQGQSMFIKNASPEKDAPEIEFWVDNNNWWRVRNKSEKDAYDYTEVAKCRVARSPGGGASCLGRGERTLLEKSLAKRLADAIRSDMSSNRVPEREKLVEVIDKEMPFLYQDIDTKKYYFRYFGQYFNAKLISETNTADNPTKFPCLRISGKSDFYQRDMTLATIVMTGDNYVQEIKDMSVFLSETLGISKDEAVLFIKKTPFNTMEYIGDVEKITNDAQMANRLYVEQPDEIIVPVRGSISEETLQDAAKKALFPQHTTKDLKDAIKIYDLISTPAQAASDIQNSMIYVRKKVDYLKKEMLPNVIDALNAGSYNHALVEDYLMEILKKSDSPFLSDVEYSLISRLRNAKQQLDSRRFKIMTAEKNAPNKNIPSAVSQDSVIFIHPQDKENVYINIDNLEVYDNKITSSAPELTGAILNALLRATGKVSHIISIPRKNGIFINVKDAYKAIQKAIAKTVWRAGEPAEIKNVISRYLKKSPIYAGHLDKFSGMPMDWLKFNYLLRYEPGFRAHLTLNSDDLSTLITQDLHYIIETAEKDMGLLHPWVKNYGELRGVMEAESNPSSAGDFMMFDALGLTDLTSVDVNKFEVKKFSGNKNIFSSENHGLLFLWEGEYYPVRFFGDSGRLIAIGDQHQVPEVCYYNPNTGDIAPTGRPFTRSKVLRHFEDMKLYGARMIGSDYTEVLRLDGNTHKLVPTGATKVMNLQGKVTRIEFPWFNLYHPYGAPRDVYIQGHSTLLTGETKIPHKMKVYLYTSEGQQVTPYKGIAKDHLGDYFTLKEVKKSGNLLENYSIKAFHNFPENYSLLAREYYKNMVQISARSMSSAELLESLSNLYGDEDVVLHLLISRPTTSKSVISKIPGQKSKVVAKDFFYTDSEPSTSRWSFDQQVEGGDVSSDHKLEGLLPLREVHVPLHDESAAAISMAEIKSDMRNVAYDIYHGLDFDDISNIPEYIISARIRISKSVDKARDILRKAYLKLTDDRYKIGISNYLSLAFGTKDSRVLNMIYERMKELNVRISGFLDESAQAGHPEIVIVSSRQTPDPEHPGKFISAITDIEHRQNLRLAVTMLSDPARRIYFYNDAGVEVKVNGELIDPKVESEPHTLIHEASHATNELLDIFYVGQDSAGVPDYYNTDTFKNNLDSVVKSGEIKKTMIGSVFMPHYYRYLGIKTPLSDEQVLELLKTDSVFRLNAMLDNADTISTVQLRLSVMEPDTPVKTKREVYDTIDNNTFMLLRLFSASALVHQIKSLE